MQASRFKSGQSGLQAIHGIAIQQRCQQAEAAVQNLALTSQRRAACRQRGGRRSEFLEVPETVKQAVLYAIGNLYEQRETMDMKSMIELMTLLLFAYRREGW